MSTASDSAADKNPSLRYRCTNCNDRGAVNWDRSTNVGPFCQVCWGLLTASFGARVAALPRLEEVYPLEMIQAAAVWAQEYLRTTTAEERAAALRLGPMDWLHTEMLARALADPSPPEGQ